MDLVEKIHRMITSKKFAIYARVSTKEQSPEMQLGALRDYAKRMNFEIVKEYVDIGISGTKEIRPPA